MEAREEGSALVRLLDVGVEDILCLQSERVVGKDNSVRYKGKSLQIPEVKGSYHFVRAKVVVGVYDREGSLVEEAEEMRRAAAG